MTRNDLKVIWWLAALSHVDRLARRRSVKSLEENVLVVRLDQIGDFILWLNSAQRLRDIFDRTKHRITLLGDKLWTSFAKELGIFDEVWDLDRKKFVFDLRYRLQLLTRVAEGGFSIAINPTFGRDFLWGDSVIRASRAAERIGIAGKNDRMSSAGRWLSDRWYTKLIPISDEIITELERNTEFLRGLGFSSFQTAIASIKSKRTTLQIVPSEKFYVLCPGAGWGIRRWPARNFAQIAEAIFAHTGWTGVICGGSGDSDIARELKNSTVVPLIDVAGQTELGETLGILARAQLVVANESGTVHLAAAAGTPSVCILGGGHYGRFLPYPPMGSRCGPSPETVVNKMECFGCNWRCKYQSSRKVPAPCILSIGVDSVWEKTASVLNRIRAGSDRAILVEPSEARREP